MIKNLKILDCTLRDGGYYTNWDFNKELVKSYLEYINLLPIDYIEVGYRSELKNEYLGEYFYLPLSTLKTINKYSNKKIVILLNAKDMKEVDIESLLIETKDYVSMIRLATDPNQIEFSIFLAKEIKKLGFEVAINVMYISKIEDQHHFYNYLDGLDEFVDIINLVDSYGSIYPEELEKIIISVKKHTSIPLGFHGHNNLELAFVNTLKAIECGIVNIDCTILGMGRGAGNLKTELMLTYLKAKYNIKVNLNILGKITELFKPLHLKNNWGTNLAYMVSGSYSLPQKDVMTAIEINRYSLSGIVNQLTSDTVLNLPKFKTKELFDNILIIGGGISVLNHLNAIKEFLSKNKDILVIFSTSKHIKSFENIENKKYFAVSGDELLKIDLHNRIDKYVLEPSPRKVNNKINDIEGFYELDKISFIDKHFDSPLTIGLQLANDLNFNEVYLVGFDGYNEVKNKKDLYLMHENQEIIDSFNLKNKLIFLTPTKYKNVEQKSIYGLNTL